MLREGQANRSTLRLSPFPRRTCCPLLLRWPTAPPSRSQVLQHADSRNFQPWTLAPRTRARQSSPASGPPLGAARASSAPAAPGLRFLLPRSLPGLPYLNPLPRFNPAAPTIWTQAMVSGAAQSLSRATACGRYKARASPAGRQFVTTKSMKPQMPSPRLDSSLTRTRTCSSRQSLSIPTARW